MFLSFHISIIIIIIITHLAPSLQMFSKYLSRNNLLNSVLNFKNYCSCKSYLRIAQTVTQKTRRRKNDCQLHRLSAAAFFAIFSCFVKFTCVSVFVTFELFLFLHSTFHFRFILFRRLLCFTWKSSMHLKMRGYFVNRNFCRCVTSSSSFRFCLKYL